MSGYPNKLLLLMLLSLLPLFCYDKLLKQFFFFDCVILIECSVSFVIKVSFNSSTQPFPRNPFCHHEHILGNSYFQHK